MKDCEEELQTTCRSINDLPWDIMFNIWGRLPLETLSDCNEVCKSWCSMIADPYFAMEYAVRGPTWLILRVQAGKFHELGGNYMVEAEDSSPHSHHPINCYAGNWCNGLLCVCSGISGNPIYVCNPILDACLSLPKVSSGSDEGSVASGLGFCSRTKEYKVIRIFSSQVASGRWEAEMCTVASAGDKWTSLGEAPYSIDPSKLHKYPRQIFGTFFNGALYWIVYGHDPPSLCSFNIANKSFSSLQLPPVFCKQKYKCSSLNVFEEHLYICARALKGTSLNPDIEIWVMDNGFSQCWTKLLNIKSPVEAWWDLYSQVQLIRTLRNGELVLVWRNRALLSYDGRIREHKEHSRFHCDSIAYVPSFASLK